MSDTFYITRSLSKLYFYITFALPGTCRTDSVEGDVAAFDGRMWIAELRFFLLQ
jgi:hypothetical protein